LENEFSYGKSILIIWFSLNSKIYLKFRVILVMLDVIKESVFMNISKVKRKKFN
jgi:hypothetical protein